MDELKQKFLDAVIININIDLYNQCLDFAKKVNTTTRYHDCGQNNLAKREYDNFIGKIAEFAVFKTLSQIGFSLDEPDTKIYQGKEKSWKSDLFIEDKQNNKYSIAVKSQSLLQAEKYNFSGTFQAASFRKDAALKNTNEIVFLCMVRDNKTNCDVLVLPPKTIGEIKFGLPKLSMFHNTKICYYAKDNFPKEKLQLWMTSFGASEKAIL